MAGSHMNPELVIGVRIYTSSGAIIISLPLKLGIIQNIGIPNLYSRNLYIRFLRQSSW